MAGSLDEAYLSESGYARWLAHLSNKVRLKEWSVTLLWYVLHVFLSYELLTLYGRRNEYLDERLEMTDRQHDDVTICIRESVTDGPAYLS